MIQDLLRGGRGSCHVVVWTCTFTFTCHVVRLSLVYWKTHRHTSHLGAITVWNSRYQIKTSSIVEDLVEQLDRPNPDIH
jgi:hypothetical protein